MLKVFVSSFTIIYYFLFSIYSFGDDIKTHKNGLFFLKIASNHQWLFFEKNNHVLIECT